MPRRYARASCFVLPWAVLLLLPLATWARHSAAPFSENGAGAPLASVSTYFIPARDGVALALAADERQRTEGTPNQFADPIEVKITPATHGTWETLPDGARLWRLLIDAPGATDLNLGFGRYHLPSGATLHVISPEHDYFEGPYTYEDNAEHGQLWLPVTPGSRAVIELYVPQAVEFEPELELTQVGYGFRDWFHLASPLRQGACNNDVVCPEAIPWRDDTRAEAVYQRSGAWTCSGQMVNNTAGDFKPYFLTANHCGLNASNAATMVVYWNFESPHCGDLCCGSLADNQTGAFWRASYAPSDFTLVELDEAPNPAWVVYWAGWDNSGGAVASVAGIHQPNCDEKAISFENNPISVTSYGGSAVPGDGTHWKVSNWDDGITEPGSSGSGIWDPNHHLVGQLHGGTSSCSLQDDPDWYGRFSASWNGGGANSSRLKNWLDPGTTGVLALDGAYAVPPVPHLDYASSASLDGCPGGGSDANGVWEPGEQVQVPVTIDAVYGGFTNVSGTLSSSTPGVVILDGSATWPNIASGGSATTNAPHFMVALSPAMICGTIIDLALDVTATEGGPYHSTFTARVGAPLVPAGLPAPINDNATTTSLLTVGQSVTLSDVNVRVEIAHSKVGNLRIQLQSPLGTTITLLDRPGVPAVPGGCANANMDVTFDDASSFDPENHCAGTDPWYAGLAMPVTPLSALNGQSSGGVWKLLVYDAQAGNTGQLLDWELLGTPALNGTCDVCTAATASPIVSSEAASFGLAPVRPNPFGSSAEIAFTLDREGKAKLEIIDVTGRRVTTLLDREMSAGRHAISWNGTDSDGQPVAAGLYFVRLVSGGRTDLERVSRLR